MDETDRPDDRRAAGSWVLPNSESRRQGNHEVAKSGIRKRKKTKTYPRLSCKIEYLLTSNHSDKSIASKFFTGDSVINFGSTDKITHIVGPKSISGSKNFRSTPQKDFCNKIGTKRPRAIRNAAHIPISLAVHS